ncbi:unnamed protein product [Ceratitis capitata]|uniref:(Mediterranean fruit fly) hypothetical protein n=1 Tax=Ceratitis capitata TaxID=7213 RepID=A0A811UQU1_CERCA|nr:unnamed protein product [Ceratitis capitata]
MLLICKEAFFRKFVQCSTDKDPFIKLGKKYYLINAAVQLNWHQAFLFCRTYSSDLATIESEAEMNALSFYLAKNGHSTKHFWIGATDIAEEGKFMSYKTGRHIVYAKWTVGQPDNAGNNEDCAHLWTINNIFEMNDWSCADGKNIICELPKSAKCCWKKFQTTDLGNLQKDLQYWKSESNQTL